MKQTLLRVLTSVLLVMLTKLFYFQVLTDTHPKVQSAGQMALQQVFLGYELSVSFDFCICQ